MNTLRPLGNLDRNITSSIAHHWNRRAATFDNDPCHGLLSPAQRGAWIEILARLAGGRLLSILDVGCGTGFLALLFAELGHSVTGVDISPEMLNIARQKAAQARLSVQFRLENGAFLQDSDCTYDLVVARHVLWVLPDPARGVREWLRVLRPSGRLALIEGKWGEPEPGNSCVNLTRSALTALLDRGTRFSGYFLGNTKLQAFLTEKLNDWKYRQLEAQLPFSGGPSVEELAAFLRTEKLEELTVEPLMAPVLWGDGPQYARYLVVGRRG